ncbi:acyl-CoA hydrolase [Thermocatellispora tengchongensis]|uniref:Acyl-CoA hydrolase n=1 Tax=Thermocatellispora tengchongensis TaxID=1073253 RepID=A0A840PN00_9ACTN|nr:acetyl-CoA hydrolase/transferase C-terminal domain-containing protein [Thermocatellispora tengchongensis]MBB5138417.1 acyl-CoA hydrolase [Thermocatellispora tengchongensis]
MAAFEDELARLVKPGARIALADGVGTPRVLHGPLSRAAKGRDVRLVLGWMPLPAPDLDPGAFADVRVLMGGPGTRAMVEAGHAHAVPTRLSAVPALLRGPLRPDLVVATVVRRADGLRLGTEVGYLRGLVDAGVPVAAVLSSGSPCADAGPALPGEMVTVIGETGDGPGEVPTPAPTAADVAIARRVARLVPEGGRVQVGPGRLAQAMVSALEVPVRIDSGLLPDPVVDLDEKGLLVGEPVAAYLSGTRRLYEWADDRPILRPVEVTHDAARLSSPDLPPLIALNSALEIDVDGQVNVEGIGSAAVGMIGGHPDFAAAGVRGRGLSVIAIASAYDGYSTLVSRLSRPVTTGSHDVDVVVTDRGIADLRGLDRPERRRALLGLWDGEIAER